METRNKTKKSSVTALAVASAFQRALNKKYAYLFSKHEEQLLECICQHGISSIPLNSLNGIFARGLWATPYSLQTTFFNYAVAPYYDEYILLRKLIVREKINSAIAKSVKQIVFLGGGYDIRAFVGAQENPTTNFYELDTGVTRQAKLKALHAISFNQLGFNNIQVKYDSDIKTKINHNLFYLECDVANNSLAHVLEQCGFDKQKPVLVIAEGLTMYLDEFANHKLLSQIHDLMDHPDSELLIGFLQEEDKESSLSVLAKNKSSESYKFHLPQESY